MKRHEARAREIEKARKAAEEARSKEYDMSPGTKGKRCCSWRVPPWEAWPAGGQAARPGGEACRAAAVTTATTALKAGAGTARTTANCGSVFCVEAFALPFPSIPCAIEIDCLSLLRLRPHSPQSRKQGEEFTRKNNSRPLPIVDFLLKNGSGGFSAMPCHPLKTV